MSRRDMEHFYSISAEEKTLPTSLSDVYFQNNQWKEGVMMLLEELRDTPDHKELLLKSKQGLIQMVRSEATERTISDLLERLSAFCSTEEILPIKSDILHALANRADNAIRQTRNDFACRTQDQLSHAPNHKN